MSFRGKYNNTSLKCYIAFFTIIIILPVCSQETKAPSTAVKESFVTPVSHGQFNNTDSMSKASIQMPFVIHKYRSSFLWIQPKMSIILGRTLWISQCYSITIFGQRITLLGEIYTRPWQTRASFLSYYWVFYVCPPSCFGKHMETLLHGNVISLLRLKIYV
jgi:hypothetical protein